MSYAKKTWGTDTPLTVADLTHIEEQDTEIAKAIDAHNATVHEEFYTRPEMEAIFWCESNDGAGTGLNVDKLSGMHVADITDFVKAGFRAWWNTANGAIPDGWGLAGTYGGMSIIEFGLAPGKLQTHPASAVSHATATIRVAGYH